MIELGKTQELEIVRTKEFGVTCFISPALTERSSSRSNR